MSYRNSAESPGLPKHKAGRHISKERVEVGLLTIGSLGRTGGSKFLRQTSCTMLRTYRQAELLVIEQAHPSARRPKSATAMEAEEIYDEEIFEEEDEGAWVVGEAALGGEEVEEDGRLHDGALGELMPFFFILVCCVYEVTRCLWIDGRLCLLSHAYTQQRSHKVATGHRFFFLLKVDRLMPWTLNLAVVSHAVVL